MFCRLNSNIKILQIKTCKDKPKWLQIYLRVYGSHHVFSFHFHHLITNNVLVCAHTIPQPWSEAVGSCCSHKDGAGFHFQLHMVTINSLLWKGKEILVTVHLEQVPCIKPSIALNDFHVKRFQCTQQSRQYFSSFLVQIFFNFFQRIRNFWNLRYGLVSFYIKALLSGQVPKNKVRAERCDKHQETPLFK